MNFLKSIGEFFAAIFTGAIKHAYESLSTAQQAAAQQASGIVAIINANLTAAPAVIWQAIADAYPGIDQAAVTAALASVAKTVNATGAAVAAGVETAITALQAYLSTLAGNKWAAISHNLVVLIVDELAPGSMVQKIEMVVEFVYQNFIKGKVAA